MGVEIVREELIGQYVQLLKDNEAEVRSAAATQIPGKFRLATSTSEFPSLMTIADSRYSRFLKTP